jgi:signal transduction histidine kinase
MTRVFTPARSVAPREPDLPLSLMRYLGEVLARDDATPAETILRELTRQFDVHGAGIAFLGHTPVSEPQYWAQEAPGADFPWRNDPSVITTLTERGEAAMQDAAGSWLLWYAAPGGAADPGVLWLNDGPARSWSETDAAALALVGQALRRTGLLGRSPGQMNEQLGQAAHVASRLSHDFGNLLTGILGFTELALAQASAGTLTHRYLSEVWDVARGGADWLKKLNLFCRRQAFEYMPTGLPGALAEEEARLGPGRWRADVPADLPALACDGESLRQALAQVLQNAREATSGGGPITLTARALDLDAAQGRVLLGSPPAGRYVEITVADSGPGLGAEVRGRLFNDLFFSSKPRHRGLGLMATYGILRRFGGGLGIGPGAGGGTEVRLYFPAAPEPVPAGPAQLLVVDDDPQVLAEARRVLEPAGYRVSIAASPAEALVLHQTTPEPFELLLIAVHLPNLSGTELARRVRLRDPQARFLFLHSAAGPALPRDELLTPATLVHKPFAPPVLLQAVASALRRAQRPVPG